MAGEQAVSTAPPFTPKLIEALQPRERDYEMFDPAAPGLCLRVTAKGSKIFRWYVNSIRRRITLGHWAKAPQPGYVTLAEARSWLERLKEAHRAGRLAEAEKELEAIRPKRRAPEPAAVAAGSPTVSEVAKDFLAHIERRRKRPEEVRRTIENEIKPAIGDRPITSITSRDIRAIVERVVAREAPTQAGKVLAHAKQLFRFACGRDDIPAAANPAYPLEPDALGVVNNMSQRFLAAEEIPLFWGAVSSSRMTPTVKAALKLLLLTGIRTCELLRAKWADIDFNQAAWTVPVANQKLTRKQEQSARPWIVPLSPTALALLRQLEAFAQGSEWVTANPFNPEACLSQKALVAGMRKLFEGEKPLLKLQGERPTPHDLRRTMRTHLGDTLGIPWHIAERCLNHAVGRITQVYDIGDYLAERRAALEKWAAYVDRLVSPTDAKVAFLRPA
jgi:integrase